MKHKLVPRNFVLCCIVWCPNYWHDNVSCNVLSGCNQMKVHPSIIYTASYLTRCKGKPQKMKNLKGDLLLGSSSGNNVVCGSNGEQLGSHVRPLKLFSNLTNIPLPILQTWHSQNFSPTLQRDLTNKSAHIWAITSTSFQKMPVPKLPNARFLTPIFAKRYRMQPFSSSMTDMIHSSTDCPARILFCDPHTVPALTAAHVSTSILKGLVHPHYHP